MERQVYKPKDAVCGKCNGPLAYYKLPSGKWCPCNLDGSDHWDDCKEAISKGTYGIQKTFINFERGKPQNPAKLKVFYSGRIPPWDGRLREFKFLCSKDQKRYEDYIN